MALISRQFLVIATVFCLITQILCDSDAITDQDELEPKDDTDQDSDSIYNYTNADPLKSMTDIDNNAHEAEISNDNERLTTFEEYSTTETYSNDDLRTEADRHGISVDEDDLKTEEDNRHKSIGLDIDRKVEDATATTDSSVPTLSGLGNGVYKQMDVSSEDIYLNRSNNDRTDSLIPATSKPTVIAEAIVPRIAELGDEQEVQGQRNPKTESSDPITAIHKPFDPTPLPPAVVDKSTTLRHWLEDSWIRAPAGILVPLRATALDRALAVWRDLARGGLNVSDIVIVGYDSNGVNWRSKHNLQPSSFSSGDRAVSDALSKLLLKYQGVNSDTGDGTMRALASAAKLVPYDSALFVVTDQGAADPQRLPLALRALLQKRLKVYTIWTDPNHPSTESEAELHELRNVSRHTEGDVLPYSLQVMDMDNPNSASEADNEQWAMNSMQTRRGKVNTQREPEIFETLLVRRGGGEPISLGIPVENGVSALKILIEGVVEHAVLYPPNDGPQIDLYNKTSVAAFSPSSRTEGLNPRDVLLVFPGAKEDMDMLSVMPAVPPPDSGMVGVWHLSIRCDKCEYRIYIGARAQLHFNIDNEKADMLKFRITGPVSSVRGSALIDEYGADLAELSYSYPPMARDPDEEESGSSIELVADVQIPSVKASRVYVKIVGRDLKGEPFARLAGPLTYQSESRMGRSASIVFPDSKNDLEAAEEINSRIYNSNLQYNDSTNLPITRALSQVVNQSGALMTGVQIGLSTRLYGAPGESLQLHFEVTNYRDRSVSFRFGAVGEQRLLTSISPSKRVVTAGQTENVIVTATIPTSIQAGARDFITFTAYGIEQVSISTFIYVTSPEQVRSDTRSPEVRYNFQGTCLGRTGESCAEHIWSATVIARDATSGLLRLTSSPIGLNYDSSFVAGSREEVIATYRSTCCTPRVVVTAVDANGNADSIIIDSSSYVTGAGIAAIVLGVFLGILLIIFIAFLIYWCVRRRRESRELPSYTTSSRNIS